MRKKGLTLSALQGAGLAMVVLVIIIAVGAQILGTIRDTQTSGSYEYNTTTAGLDAMEEFGNWFTIIVLVLIAVVIIALLIRGLGGMSGGV